MSHFRNGNSYRWSILTVPLISTIAFANVPSFDSNNKVSRSLIARRNHLKTIFKNNEESSGTEKPEQQKPIESAAKENAEFGNTQKESQTPLGGAEGSTPSAIVTAHKAEIHLASTPLPQLELEARDTANSSISSPIAPVEEQNQVNHVDWEKLIERMVRFWRAICPEKPVTRKPVELGARQVIKPGPPPFSSLLADMANRHEKWREAIVEFNATLYMFERTYGSKKYGYFREQKEWLGYKISLLHGYISMFEQPEYIQASFDSSSSEDQARMREFLREDEEIAGFARYLAEQKLPIYWPRGPKNRRYYERIAKRQMHFLRTTLKELEKPLIPYVFDFMQIHYTQRTKKETCSLEEIYGLSAPKSETPESKQGVTGLKDDDLAQMITELRTLWLVEGAEDKRKITPAMVDEIIEKHSAKLRQEVKTGESKKGAGLKDDDCVQIITELSTKSSLKGDEDVHQSTTEIIDRIIGIHFRKKGAVLKDDESVAISSLESTSGKLLMVPTQSMRLHSPKLQQENEAAEIKQKVTGLKGDEVVEKSTLLSTELNVDSGVYISKSNIELVDEIIKLFKLLSEFHFGIFRNLYFSIPTCPSRGVIDDLEDWVKEIDHKYLQTLGRLETLRVDLITRSSLLKKIRLAKNPEDTSSPAEIKLQKDTLKFYIVAKAILLDLDESNKTMRDNITKSKEIQKRECQKHIKTVEPLRHLYTSAIKIFMETMQV